ncbi:microsomal triglyceride transfer protein-like [Pseudophryne corroboree]|uniref:microsomal triglyceride transfer protein-like n=1 Tax=Pseudophryne corroboree TaxID=495146 RepID=UPI003081D270
MSYLHALLFLLCYITQGWSGVPLFQPETTYQYAYTVNLMVAHVSQPSMPRTRLDVEATVDAYLLWRNKKQPDEQLIYLQMKDINVYNKATRQIPGKKEDLTTKHLKDAKNKSSLEFPVLFHWNAGKVLSLYSTGEKDSQVLDLKRGLVSLFQFQPLNGTRIEDDVSGRCQVTYNVSNDFINKTKDLNSCMNSPFGYEADHKVLGVSWNSSSRGYMSLNGTTFKKALLEENHNLSARLRSVLGVHITSRQQLEYISSTPGPPEIDGESIEKILGDLPEKYQKEELLSHPNKPSADKPHPLLKKYLEISRRKASKLTTSKTSTVRHFQTAVSIIRHAKKRDVLQLLQTASSDLAPFFIDAAVAAQSPASIAALSDFLDFAKKKQVQLQEKFLHSAAFAPHPSVELLNLVLRKLMGKVADAAIMETGIVITGAIVGKLCRMEFCEEKDVELAKATILEGLNNAEDETEMKIYLLSLKNAQLPETIPILVQYAEEHTGVVCSTALSALQSFPAEIFSTEEVKDTLRCIFHQTHQQYDNKCRLMAAETLLSANCSLVDLNSISAGLKFMDTEHSKLLLSKVCNKLRLQHIMRLEGSLLKDKFLNNYWTMSQAGRSTVFSGLLTDTNEMLSTYGLDLLFSESGLLKRSISDITLYDHSNHLKAMQVSIDAQGLESLMGDDEAEDGEDEAMVGMSAILFDVQLRPVVFFQGYMDLMTKVFSSTGEPKHVVKGNILFVEYLQWLPLQSGLHATSQYQGALGLDITANIDVSIWDQQSKTNINTKAGIVLEFKTEIDTSFFHADMKAQIDAQTSVNLDSVMKFTGSPMLMCLELRHDDLPYRETYIITESFPEMNATHTVQKGRKATLWGRDFPFHNSNSEMCRTLKVEEDTSTIL